MCYGHTNPVDIFFSVYFNLIFSLLAEEQAKEMVTLTTDKTEGAEDGNEAHAAAIATEEVKNQDDLITPAEGPIMESSGDENKGQQLKRGKKKAEKKGAQSSTVQKDNGNTSYLYS